MAKSLEFPDFQPNLNEISEELCVIGSRLNKKKMFNEKIKEKTNESDIIDYQMKLNNRIGKKLTTVMEYLKFYFNHVNFKNKTQKDAIDSILKRKCKIFNFDYFASVSLETLFVFCREM